MKPPLRRNDLVEPELSYEIVGKGFLDFSIDSKIIAELKKDGYFSKTHLEQVLNYLKMSNLKLAILINFTNEGVKFKRIVNINQ